MREKPVIEVAEAGLTPMSPAEVMKDESAANLRRQLRLTDGGKRDG
jgi:hypothetical protein